MHDEIPQAILGLLGQVVDLRYRVDSIARVEGAIVTLAGQHLLLKRDVEIRVVPADAPAEARLAFSREAEITARLDHAGCVHGYECGSLPDGMLFLVTTPLPANPLSSRLANTVPAEEAVAIGTALLGALEHVHGLGIVHGDVNPNTVRLLADGDSETPLLTGFSHAHFVGELAPSISRDPTLAAYLTPEIAAGAPPRESADVYAVGAMVYHLLAGRGPRGTPPTMSASAMPLPPHVPAGLATVVLRMIADAPGERFVSAERARAALERWREEEVASPMPMANADDWGPEAAAAVMVTARPAPARSPAPSSALPELTQPTGVRVEPQAQTGDYEAAPPVPGRKGPWLALAAMLVVLAGLSTAVILKASGGDSEVAVAGSGASIGHVAGLPADAEADPEAPAPTAVETKTDHLRLLALINNDDIGTAPNYDARQGYLTELRGSAAMAKLIDEELNAVIDLAQAPSAKEPCPAFETGLARLEAGMTGKTQSKLTELAIEAPDGDASCDGLAERLAKLTAPPAVIASAPRQTTKHRRKRGRSTGRAREKTAPQPSPPAATAPPPPKPKPKRKGSARIAEKLDDELRPFGH